MPKEEKRGRGRPPKKPADRKDQYLRIPVTVAQKATVDRAAVASGYDFAAWARATLLVEAGRVLGENG